MVENLGEFSVSSWILGLGVFNANPNSEVLLYNI